MSDERGEQDPRASGAGGEREPGDEAGRERRPEWPPGREPVVPPAPPPRLPPPPPVEPAERSEQAERPATVAAPPRPEPTPPRQAPPPTTVPGARVANPTAVASLVIGFIAILTGVFPFTAPVGFALGVLALVLGGIGMAKSREASVSGRGLAITGVVTGLIGLIAACIWVAVYFVGPRVDRGNLEQVIRREVQGIPRLGPTRPINALEIGDCFNTLPSSIVDEVFVVPCAQLHEREVYAILESPAGPDVPYPGLNAMRMAALGQCRADPFSDYTGSAYSLLSPLEVFAFYPTQNSWAAGDRSVICTLSGPAERTTGSLRGIAERVGPPPSPRPSPPPTLVPRPLPPPAAQGPRVAT
jgi:hypothetical protein